MPPTLASLVHHSALKLTVLAGGDRLDTPVRWAHVSELADPVPWMEGGELLLTTAMKIDAADPDTVRPYVRRLVRAGVVGLGFAVGVNYERTPPALVDAAAEAGLPLLEVPRRTPFIAISKAVSAAIAAEQYRAVTAGFEAQRELTRAALGADGPAGVLARLAACLDGWAALYDASGTVVAAAPEWATRRASRLGAQVERLRERSAPASAVVAPEEGEDRVELQSLGTGRRARGVLAVGTGAPLGTSERYAVNSAVALLTLATERSRALHQAEQRLARSGPADAAVGQADHARDVAGELYGALLDAPFRVAGCGVGAAPGGRGGPGRPAGRAGRRGGDAASRAGEAVLAVPEGERLVVLAPDGGAAVAACAEFAETAGGARAVRARRAPRRAAFGRPSRRSPSRGGAGARAGRARGRRGRFRPAAPRGRRGTGLRGRAAARPPRP
ncbi:hypothetical protein GCM10020221_03640 [Streptomyces thioluteus]|uniref:Purine catabolism PurC-like domain-containing protein n=1 Tax=Streptomyces thioluteus TaxID=66431 RepID=A0ABN3WD52_STRTU